MKSIKKVLCSVMAMIMMISVICTTSVNAEEIKTNSYTLNELLNMDNAEFFEFDGVQKMYDVWYYQLIGIHEQKLQQKDLIYVGLVNELGLEEAKKVWHEGIFSGIFLLTTEDKINTKEIDVLISGAGIPYEIKYVKKTLTNYGENKYGYLYTVSFPDYKEVYATDEILTDLIKIRYCLNQIGITDMAAAGVSPYYLQKDEPKNLYDVIAIAKHIMGIVLIDDSELQSYDFDNNGIIDLNDAIAIAKTLM